MDKGSRFDWRQLGKPDYSQCHALVASLPLNLRQKISGVSTELLVRVLHLSWTFAWRSGRGTGYCWPMQSTLAAYINRCVRTVRRHLQSLQDSGLLRLRTRRTASNGYTSNLYIIGNTLAASLFARLSQKGKQNHRGTQMSDNDLKREYKTDAPISTGGRVSDFILKIARERGLNPLGDRPLSRLGGGA